MGDDRLSEGSERVVPTDIKLGDVVADEYTIVSLLGFGSAGEVWRSESKRTGQVVAIKVMYTVGTSVRASRASDVAAVLSSSSSADTRYFCVPVSTAIHLRHPCLIFDLCGMSIRDALGPAGVFPIPTFQIRSILWQVCTAISFLHSVNIVHTDIKPDNIVLVDDKRVDIKDIGSDGILYDKKVLTNIQIKIIDLEESVTNPRNIHFIPGTTGYRAPEVYGSVGWAFPVDIFAIGCLSFELFTGSPLFPKTEEVLEHFFCLEKMLGNFDPIQAQDISELHPSLFRTKSRNPKIRGGTLLPKTRNRLLRHVTEMKWLRKSINQPDAIEFMGMCTALDPHRRLTIESTLRHRLFSKFSRVI